jgi:TM2 domain-containing membrane protein YozV
MTGGLTMNEEQKQNVGNESTAPPPPPPPPSTQPPPPPTGQGFSPSTKEKLPAGLLAIFLGWLGIHKFYLGYQKEALIMLLVSVVGGIFTCGAVTGVVSIIGLVEGIMYLTKSDEEFQEMYVKNQKPWF